MQIIESKYIEQKKTTFYLIVRMFIIHRANLVTPIIQVS